MTARERFASALPGLEPGRLYHYRLVAENAGRHLKRVLLELGGKAPLVVLADADLDEAVAALRFTPHTPSTISAPRALLAALESGDGGLPIVGVISLAVLAGAAAGFAMSNVAPWSEMVMLTGVSVSEPKAGTVNLKPTRLPWL